MHFNLKAKIVSLFSFSDSGACEGRHNIITTWQKHESFPQVLELAKHFVNKTQSSFR